MTSTISIQGARNNNLKNINIDLPHHKLIVITGLSGSGKSSLAYDTICAGGQGGYIESLSPFIRHFLPSIEKPDVDHMHGLSPAIAIQQKTSSYNPRSTVGTMTEIYDYLRLLFARVGEPYCPTHKVKLTAHTVTQMTDHILSMPLNTRFSLLAPILQNKKGEHNDLIAKLKQEGYIRVRWNNKIMLIDDLPPLTHTQYHSLDIVVDRLMLGDADSIRSRLVDSLETTLRLSNGTVKVSFENSSFNELVFSTLFACPDCQYSSPPLDPRLFSFNNAMGACPDCNGLGVKISLLNLNQSHSNSFYDWVDRMNLFKEAQHDFLDDHNKICEACKGHRLRIEAQHVFLENTSLPELAQLSLDELQAFFSRLSFKGQRQSIAHKLLLDVNSRLSFLIDVGVEYLTLSRPADTLSGGEAQRIRLASQIGSGLIGVMYILDEPSIGLHARDNTRLLKTLDKLRDLGNTIIVVEHDEETMRHADYLVEIGPGAGIHGGRIVAQGKPQQVIAHSHSLTGQYLSGKRRIPIPKNRIALNLEKILILKDITKNNLQSVTLTLPLGLMSCITGVSGSGKSTLINQALYPILQQQLDKKTATQDSQTIEGLQYLDKVIAIDQKPIGRTPRSNPATYTGLFDAIRELFTATLEARARGYQVGRFSFNVKKGRCHACEGLGLIKVEMHFLPDIHVTCDTCQGKRYNQETLEIKYKGKNIHEVLSMTVEDAFEFFKPVPTIARKLKTLIKVGLTYITLGQSATTFSGGEAQRIKLAKELSRRDTGKTLYILDEPTTGLHFYDIEQLLKVLDALRDRGNTIVVIEHNLDVIKTADWVIDLGPEGGKKGGHIIATGTPEEITNVLASYTGQYLKPILARI